MDQTAVQPQLKLWAARNRERYGLTIRGLASKAGISHSTAALFFKHDARLGFDACLAVASVFGTPLMTVLEMAELVPARPAETRETSLLIELYHRLDDGDKRELVNFAEYLKLKATKPRSQLRP